MMRALPALALVAAMLPAAHADECEDAADQATMSACAQQAYAASDAEMKRLYREIELRLGDDADAKQLLAEAEQAWNAYRDAECTFSSSAVAGGSAFPMVRALCLDELTQKRVEDLQQYLTCAEGDLGCAVPPASLASDDMAADQPYAFPIDLTFTADALDTLGSRDEEVVVSVSYYADPAADGEQMADDVGRIDLGREEVQVAAEPEIVEITGSQLDVDALQWTEGDIMVEVSIYSARLSGPDNLISCDIIEGRLADVTVTPPIELQCSMIEEDMEIEVRP